MKAESSINAVRASSRNTVYSRPASKRVNSALKPLSPSAGIQKSRSKSSLSSPPRKVQSSSYSPSTRLALELQRQRQQQLITLEREVRCLLEEEYREDVTAYMHQVELVTMSSPASMDMQPEIQWHMRACLVEFLIEVHLNFQLRPETLYLTCNIVDRYVSRRVVYKKHYQLVGCAALWIAAKFEDAKERVPTVRDLCEICRDEYDETAFIQMEGHVLATIAWRVGHPTAEAWLRVACVGVCFEDSKTQHVARFLMEITLFHREYVSFPPSVIARAALLLARYTLGKSRRPFEETEAVVSVVQLLDTHLSESLDQLSQMLVKKYSYSYYSKASTHIVHYYLQGNRYTYVPISYIPSPTTRPITGPVPSTPTNRMLPRVPVQAWPSASSSASSSEMSSTPSFDGSEYSAGSFTDFSSEADESLPRTPSSSVAMMPNLASVSVSLEPLNLHGFPSQSVVSSTVSNSNAVVHGSNKENNRPASISDANVLIVGVSSNVENAMMVIDGASDSSVGHGTRSRKSSLEVVQTNIPLSMSNHYQGISMDPATMDMCMPSPRSREATYVPRAALALQHTQHGSLSN